MRLSRQLRICNMSSRNEAMRVESPSASVDVFVAFYGSSKEEKTNINGSNVLGIHGVVLDLEIDHVVVANEQLVAPVRPPHNARVGLAHGLAIRVVHLRVNQQNNSVRSCHRRFASTASE